MTKAVVSDLASERASAMSRQLTSLSRVVLMLSVLVVIGHVSSSIVNAQSQLQLNQEACDEYNKADAEMNAAYQRIRRDYRQDAQFIAALKKAQLAWLSYRDAHLQSLYPGAASQYGSVNPMCRCMELAEITKARTVVLNRWVEGVEEGDVCAGSRKVK